MVSVDASPMTNAGRVRSRSFAGDTTLKRRILDNLLFDRSAAAAQSRCSDAISISLGMYNVCGRSSTLIDQ